MSPQIFYMLAIGISAGIFSGLFGIGGGLVIVPALIWVGLSQHEASGTSLVALLLPVGLLGVIEYYRAGALSTEHIKYGLLIALGLFFGAFLGSKISVSISDSLLRKSFALLLVFSAFKMWFAGK
ncbi:conserved hypothetical protein [Chloroherpeton thalassium ATCC 35110]|uniref:Probable membrane transporter protein n=1 Tax=Chloroherpeton thalassium (strain ATCC 35110 / GB-78) TaxID=517418 RepID=B3QRX1_CHLT3|nr:sulfite exporter TauE/SafE family protein [Chloroherpeton thalassium]ACF13924.1 conserved hypothetical protein [Chloroherpeton thalassium ATCC 35110]